LGNLNLLHNSKMSRPESELIGQNIGNYRIDALLAQGGMGGVHRATHTSLDRKLALKTHFQLEAGVIDQVKKPIAASGIGTADERDALVI